LPTVIFTLKTANIIPAIITKKNPIKTAYSAIVRSIPVKIESVVENGLKQKKAKKRGTAPGAHLSIKMKS
jgi:hypothetical protein